MLASFMLGIGFLIGMSFRVAWSFVLWPVLLMQEAATYLVMLLGHGFAIMVATVVVQQVVFMSCDAVWMVMRIRTLGWPVKSLKWCSLCLSVWFIMLVLQAPMLLCVLSEQPVLVAWSQTALLCKAYRAVLRAALGSVGGAGLLSARCQQAHARQAELVHMRGSSEHTSNSAVFFALLLGGYVFTRFWDLVRSGCWTALTCAVLAQIQMQRMTSARTTSPLRLWKILWTITPEPVHCVYEGDAIGSAVVEDCDKHEQCAVCLDNLCTTSDAVARGPLGVFRRRHPGLAMCRSRPALASASASAARRWGLSLYKGTFSSLARQVAELPCGHQFHLGCIDDVARTRLQCPTCRQSLGDTWADLTDGERFTIRVGWVAVIVLWSVLCLVQYWNGQGTEPASFVNATDAVASAAAAAGAEL
mmetsp:Transcript_129289/g.322271  ORF Transcript_129289/g.322271 Transcript_129289/m.322271 type:complete len:417 (-) Transcript_129289:11-1261(-)